MRRVLLLARRYVAYYRLKTMIVVACITLSIYLPVAMQLLVDHFQQQLASRGRTTPLVVGAKGSRFDLALHALYFQAEPPEFVTAKEAERIRESGWAVPIPLFIRYRARGYPVVGTDLEYFTFRGLKTATGGPLTRLGDCVVGSAVARDLEIEPGDYLLSDPENVYDLAGAYPLRMRVVGVLAETHEADDEAVFVDLKTAWIIHGIGHGHQAADEVTEESAILERTEDRVVASAALPHYTEINDENIGSFHFHGDPESFPLTAVIAVPRDDKSATLLMGRYLAPNLTAQIIRPARVVDELFELVFKIKRFFDVSAWLLGLVTVLFLALVVLLSLRLRSREMETMFKIGCSRFTIFWLQAAELAIVMAVSTALAGGLAASTLATAPYLIRAWIFS